MFEKLSKMLKIYKFAANAVLKDGTEILIDGNMDIGVSVYVVTDDGNQPLPDGEWELGEPYIGYVIVIEGGVITNILEPVVEDDDMPEEEVEEEVDAEEADTEEETEPSEDETETDEVSLEDQISKLEELIQSVIDRLDKIEASNDELSKENDDLKKSNEDFSSQVDEFKEKLEKMNGADPLKKKISSDQFSKLSPRKRVLRDNIKNK